MKNFEVHAMVDGWIGQAATLEEAINMRDQIYMEFPHEEVKIMAEVNEEDLMLHAQLRKYEETHPW